MEFTLCYWFWSFIAVILSFFILFVVIPVTISLISHLVLTTSILLLFSWTIFFTIKIFTLLVWSSLFLPTCINCCWSRGCNCWLCNMLHFCLWSYLYLNTVFFLTALLTFLFNLGRLVLLVTFLTSARIFGVLLCLQGCCTSLEINLRCYICWGRTPLSISSLIATTVIAMILTVIPLVLAIISVLKTITIPTLVMLFFRSIPLLLATFSLLFCSCFSLCLEISTFRFYNRHTWFFSYFFLLHHWCFFNR